MNTFNQITAQTFTSGVELVWDNRIGDFVSYEKEVPSTDEEDVKLAVKKAKEYVNINIVTNDVIDSESLQCVSYCQIYKRG